MSKLERRKRRQKLQEAEGYLELLLVVANRWSAAAENRDRIAQRALDALSPLSEGTWQLGQIRFLQGQALRLMDRHAEAVVALDESLRIEPENIHAHLAKAWCHKRLKRLDQAIETLERALEVDCDKAIVHYNLACYWSLAKNPKLAVRYLASAFDIDAEYRDMVDGETDFDAIRQDPDFQMLTSVVV